MHKAIEKSIAVHKVCAISSPLGMHCVAMDILPGVTQSKSCMATLICPHAGSYKSSSLDKA